MNVHIIRSEGDYSTITLALKLKMLLFIKVSFNIRDHTIVIRQMSFKCLIFLTVYPRDVFTKPIKILWWTVFVNVVNDF